jgi:hypothetical protein
MYYLFIITLLYISCVSCLINNRIVKKLSLTTSKSTSSSFLLMASDPRSNKMKGLGGKVIVTGLISYYLFIY